MPGNLFGSGGGSKPGAGAQPGSQLTVSTPGYGIDTGINLATGNPNTSLNTGGAFGQDAFASQFPQMSTQLQGMTGQAGTAYQNYLNSIGYGTPNAQSPFLSPLASIENARQSAMSTLSDSLARRGVMGSSFGADQLTQQDLAYQQLKSQTQLSIAGNVLSNQFATLQQQQSTITQNTALITTSLDKEFRDFAAANGLTTNFDSLTANISMFDQKLAAEQSSGIGSFISSGLGLTNGGLGNLLGMGGLTGSGSGGLGGLFGGGAAGAAGGAAAGGAAAGGGSEAAMLAAGLIAL